MRASLLLGLVLAASTSVLTAIAGCGGSVSNDIASNDKDVDDTTKDAAATDADRPKLNDGGNWPDDAGPQTREPKNHRATATPCTGERRPGSQNIPDSGGPPAECHADSECPEGRNGRCTGNGHDGWRCTYDECSNDSECTAGGVCACDGGWRSGADVCLPGNCQIDAQCGEGGYCSPTFGSCGSYGGTVGFYCHTPKDECIDDSECISKGSGGPGSCRYDKNIGHWACAFDECAG